MAIESDYRFDAFISHSHRQHEWALAVCTQWQGLGLTVFLDERDITSGQTVRDSILEGLRDSRNVVLALTPAAIGSDWVKMEASAALYEERTSGHRRLRPVLLKPIPPELLPGWMRDLVWIDLTNRKTLKRQYRKLLTELGASIDPDAILEPPCLALDDNETLDPSATVHEIQFSIRIEYPMEDFGDEQLERFLVKARDLGAGEVTVVAVRSGSVVLELAAPYAVALRLYWAARSGEFDDIAVVDVDLPVLELPTTPQPDTPTLDSALPDAEEVAEDCVVRLSGHMTSDNPEGLESRLQQLIVEESVRRLIIDMSDVEFLDASGLLVLVKAHQFARRRDCTIVLCGLRHRIEALFEMTRLNTMFSIVDDVQAARPLSKDRSKHRHRG